ncbi:hypothetical protein EVAR_96145_1 [Eumeta japonica]|uniref:Uncharacterized protein n=1 Tax=Eumeta variegata TaxID=151549 RepID=A0A4C1VIW9_EUMVA|nr:hypothetical protein EVAR_96145_1 [Eumeta japonica]
MSTKPARARGRGGGRAGARQDRTERNEHYRIQLNIKYLWFARVCPSACEARVCESVPKASGIEPFGRYVALKFTNKHKIPAKNNTLPWQSGKKVDTHFFDHTILVVQVLLLNLEPYDAVCIRRCVLQKDRSSTKLHLRLKIPNFVVLYLFQLYFLFMFTFFIVLGLACLVALLWYQRRHGLDPASSATEPFREDTPLSRRPHPDAF